MTRISRIFAAVAGALLLAVIAPRTNPWTMSLLPIKGGTIRLGPAAGAPALPLWLVLLVAAGVALAPWLILRLRRRGAASGSVQDRILLVGSLAVLAFSLIPAASRGRGAVTTLLLGAAGITLLTIGLSTPAATSWIDRKRREAMERLRATSPRALVVAAFLLVLVAACLGSQLVLGAMPHVVDSAAQLFHARIFLDGALTAPAPESEPAFRFTHMLSSDRWYSQYPPGHTLLLALGLLVRAAWLIGPLFGALAVASLFLVGRETYDDTTGRIALLLGVACPFLWLMSSTHMSHATVLLFLSLFLFGFVRMMNAGQAWAALLAGLAAGVALNIRPLTAVAFVAPFGIYAAFALARTLLVPERRAQSPPLVRNVLLAGAAFALPLAALLAFNQATNGDPFVFGYEALHGSKALLGFGKEGWWGVPHTPWRGLKATLNHLNALNQYLFGLPLPSLVLPLFGLAAIRRTRWDWLLAASAASLVAAHFFYWYQDLTYGPRFLYAAVLPLLLLTARSLTGLPALFERLYPGRNLIGAAGIALAVAAVFGWTVIVPQAGSFYARNYYGANPEVVRAARIARLSNAVVLVPDFHYPSLFPLNTPALDGNVTYARDLGPAGNRELAMRFPERSFYRLRSYDTYRVDPYDPAAKDGVATYRLGPGTPLELELSGFQLSHVANGFGRDLWTGELGSGFRNHDQFWIASGGPGLEAGVILDSDRDETRSLELRVLRSPDSGILEIRLNGVAVLPEEDLYDHRTGVRTVRVERVPLRAGRNGLLLRVTGKNEASRSFGLGLDLMRLE